MNSDTLFDVAVVGAGAAGLMTSIVSARDGRRVLLLDSQEKTGAKIIMSGGTRCNLTNSDVTERDFQSEKIRTVKNILSVFPSNRAVEFFKTIGVDVVSEEGGKYFPATHSGRAVLEALLREAHHRGVVLEKRKKVTKAHFKNDHFEISGENFSYKAKKLVLCTGGLSFPKTGSDGTGYAIAKSFGHTLIPTIPALTPLEIEDASWKNLSGLSIRTRLTLWVNQKKQISYEGSMLFTHFGLSGPVILNMSRHWIRAKEEGNVKLTAHFLPSFTEDAWRHQLIESSRTSPTRSLKNELAQKLPDRLIEVLCQKSNVLLSTPLGQLKREERERLIRVLCASPIEITKAVGYNKAEVTAGGVHLEEVNPKTLESLKQPGLFLAGEILDVDGRIGGFNFQWAWSSGYVVGKALSSC